MASNTIKRTTRRTGARVLPPLIRAPGPSLTTQSSLSVAPKGLGYPYDCKDVNCNYRGYSF